MTKKEILERVEYIWDVLESHQLRQAVVEKLIEDLEEDIKNDSKNP